MNNLEIERKFLVSGAYKSAAVRSYRIRQGYLAKESGRTVRVRIRDEQGFLTIKGPSLDDGLSRFEWETEIPLADAEALLQLRISPLIDKVRYIVPFEGHTFEVDEFHGENEGLTVAEVELSAPDEPFLRPSWLGQEVTGDPRYYNSHLALHPYSRW